ncbi:aminotransferase class V-fold PLP-dependent enzyme [Jonesiaceae bacterium BS-20]|uniref:Aminotransferase class V-fold PLP-dependent enzyme n=1 Tax=Jonesiaceae bacterium BS-20 TaxID=3120821 RepID=A0AAU7DTR0_9MICO
MLASPPQPLRLRDGSAAAAAWNLSPGVLHLNHGSFGAVPRVTLDYQAELKNAMESDPVAWFVELPERIKQQRELLATTFGSPIEATSLIPNASAGATIIYNSIPVQHGLEIVVTNHGYGAVTMGAERLVRRWGGKVVTADIPLAANADEALAAIEAVLSERTRLIVVDQVTSSTARLLPVQQIVELARAKEILTLIDGAHVFGLYQNVFDDFAPDFWIGNLHKFACGPRGAALLVAQSELNQEIYPLIDSWGYPSSYPERFDIQGTLDQTSYLAAHRSWEFVANQWGWDKSISYMTELAEYGQDVISQAFADHTGQDHTATVGMPANALKLIKLPEGLIRNHAEADAVRDRFVREGAAEAAFTEFGGKGYLRISAHVYNTHSEYEEFAERFVPQIVSWARELN